MNIQDFFLLLVSVVSSASGQFFLKSGAVKLGKVNPVNNINFILNIATTPELLAGLTCYALGTIVYIMLLSRVKLSVAGPSLSLVYAFSVILGCFVFGENVPVTRLLGLGFITLGVVLVIYQR